VTVPHWSGCSLSPASAAKIRAWKVAPTVQSGVVLENVIAIVCEPAVTIVGVLGSVRSTRPESPVMNSRSGNPPEPDATVIDPGDTIRKIARLGFGLYVPARSGR
jgi:hypothetical protein